MAATELSVARSATYHALLVAQIEGRPWTAVEAALEALQQLRRMLHKLCAVRVAAYKDEIIVKQLRRLAQLQFSLHSAGWQMHLN